MSAVALAGKHALLHWCQQRATPYRRCGIAVENFATSFADGRAFVALVHSQWPASVPHPQTLAAEDAQANLTLAFDAAEAKGVFRLLDAELIASSGKPEPKTVMTYLAELRKQIRKAEGVEALGASPSRSQSMPAMSVGGGSAKDDVASLLAGVDLSTLKRPSRPKAGGAAPAAAAAAQSAAAARPRAKTTGPPAIPKKKAGAPPIPKKKAMIPGKGAAVKQSTKGVTVAFDQEESAVAEAAQGGGSSGSQERFEDMRPYQLKAECKKRGLPDTGDRDEMLAHLELFTGEAEDV